MGEQSTNALFKTFFLFLFFISAGVYGQFYHGLDVGINSTQTEFMVGESVEPSRGTGFHVGYMFERELSDRVFLRLGLNFNRRAFKAIKRSGINTSNEKWAIDVIEVPVNLGYYINFNRRNFQFFVDAGFNAGFNNRAIFKNDTETVFLDIGGDADVKRLSFGANASVGLLIKKRVKFRVNYYHGLTNIVNTDNDTWKNRTIGVSVNYFLREKEVY